MPGFGMGPFGQEPFGEWPWGRQVFWWLLEEFERQADANIGGFLEDWMESIRVPFDFLRLRIRDITKQRDPLTVRSRYDETTLVRLGEQIIQYGAIEQRGITGAAPSLGSFYAPNARFEEKDVGKILTIRGSSVPTNNQRFVISTIVDRQTVVTDPLISADVGPLAWGLQTQIGLEEGILTYEVVSGDVDDIAPGWILNDGETLFDVVARRRFPNEMRAILVDRSGSDGEILSSGRFRSGLAAFKIQDVGRPLVITGFENGDNDGKYEISTVDSALEVTLADTTGALVSLAPDAGPLNWALLPFPQIDVSSVATPKGVVEKSGVDLEVNSPSQVYSPSATFAIEDVGKLLEIRNSASGNDGLYEIINFVDVNTLDLDSSLSPDTTVLWRSLPKTLVGDTAQVEVFAPSLLERLAVDFGIEVDTQQTEARQRAWVRHVSDWVPIKGVPDSYRIVGALSGFEVAAYQLWRISKQHFENLPSALRVEAGEGDHNGADGSLTGTWPALFSSPTAEFRPGHVGLNLRISGSGSGNDGLYTVAAYIDAQTIELDPADLATLPDAANPNLAWTLVRLYGNRAPTLPYYDEVIQELVHDVVVSETDGAFTFDLDQYCWEADWSSDLPVSIIAATQLYTNRYRVTVEHRTGAIASAAIGFGTNGTVNLVANAPGVGGNLITVEVFSQTPTPNAPLSVTYLNPGFEVYLGTDGAGVLDPTKNTALLVAAAINGAVPTVTATATGTGASPLTGPEPLVNFSGGKDEFPTLPEAILIIGRWLLEDDNGETYWIETLPTQSAVGPPPEYDFEVTAVAAPVLGDAILRYQCEEVSMCSVCPSYKILVTASLTAELASEGPLAIERAWERLITRLEQVKPAHVEMVLLRTQAIEATMAIRAEVEALGPSGAVLYSPVTVYADEVDADLYPADRALRVVVDAPGPLAIFRGTGSMSITGTVT